MTTGPRAGGRVVLLALLVGLPAALLGCADETADAQDLGDRPDRGDVDLDGQDAAPAAHRDAFAADMTEADDSGAIDDATIDATADAMFDATADAMPDRDAGPADADPPPDAEPADMAPEPDMAPPEGPAVYRSGRTQSPLTPWVADNLRAIAARAPRDPHVFSKVGASATVSAWFLHCFAGDAIDLDGRDGLQATIDHFRQGDADGTDPFSRESLSATVGWSARNALAGDPSALQQEMDATDARYAVVMYGTNDIQRRDIDGYAGDLLTLVDTLTAQGIIPLLSSIMPRDDDPDADLLVPSYNAVVRGVAQSRQVPFIDYHRELVVLPDHGLGADRLHPSVYRTAEGARACDLTPDGLTAGYNIRNLVTITALDRVRAVVEGAAPPDAPAPALDATGAVDDPIVVTALPYTDVRDTRDSPYRVFAGYPACDAGQDESGPEYVYRLHLDRPTVIRAWVLDRGDVDVDLHLLGGPDPAQCLARNHREINASLDPGDWYLVVDTFVSGGSERAGEYLLVVVEG